MSFLARSFSKLNLVRILPATNVIASSTAFHTSAATLERDRDRGPTKFLEYNEVIHPPQRPDETPRPAYVCHLVKNIKYSPFKMYFVASMVRGKTVDEALRQLKVCTKKGATYVHDCIVQAQEMAVKDHNVEFKSNLWVAESFSSKAMVIKGLRRHAKRRAGLVEYMYCHYFVRLEEGQPPKDYYGTNPKSPDEQLEQWLAKMRARKIVNSL